MWTTPKLSALPKAISCGSATGAAKSACMPSFGGGARRGVVIAEGLWPNDAHLDGEGINVLTGADAAAPYGGAAFHDNSVWMRRD